MSSVTSRQQRPTSGKMVDENKKAARSEHLVETPTMATVLLIYCYGGPFLAACGVIATGIGEVDGAPPMHHEIGVLIAWHILVAVFVHYGPTMPLPTFLVSSVAILSFAMAFVSNPIINTIYSMTALMYGVTRVFTLRHQPHTLAIRSGFVSKMVWCCWFQNLGKGKRCLSTSQRDVHLRAAAVRLALAVVGAPCVYLLRSRVAELPLVEQFHLDGPAKGALGGVLVYICIDVVDLVYSLPPLLLPSDSSPRVVRATMDSPFHSKSLVEFWGLRWDTAVQTMLHDAVYTVAFKAGASKSVASFATFLASAFVHVFGMVAYGLSTFDCGMMLLFFVAQAVLCTLDKTLFGDTNTPLRQLYAYAALTLTAPLFVSPLMG
eukprot:m.205846 g.205846  ORF g.205846 m.205846 type:complete len:377 (-) comp32930_c0_seq2:187-1317(-)